MYEVFLCPFIPPFFLLSFFFVLASLFFILYYCPAYPLCYYILLFKTVETTILPETDYTPSKSLNQDLLKFKRLSEFNGKP